MVEIHILYIICKIMFKLNSSNNVTNLFIQINTERCISLSPKISKTKNYLTYQLIFIIYKRNIN